MNRPDAVDFYIKKGDAPAEVAQYIHDLEQQLDAMMAAAYAHINLEGDKPFA